MKNLAIAIICFIIAVGALLLMSCATAPPSTEIGLGSVQTSPVVFMMLATRIPGLSAITMKSPGNVRLNDTEYYVPTYAEAKLIIHSAPGIGTWKLPVYIAEMYDCDNFADELAVNVARTFKGPAPVAFGVASVPGHSLNIMLCTEGVLLYDWQTDVTRSVTPEDKIFFIEM